MTGLDITKDHLIEIAVLITDGDLNIVEKVNFFSELRREVFDIKRVLGT